MIQAMLNTKLYQKMFTEQEPFKAEVMLLPPVEVLDKVYEHVYREDILMALEYNDLSSRQALALLKSPTRWQMSLRSWMARRKVTTWKISGTLWKPVPMKWYGLILLKLGEMRGDVPWHTFHQK